MQAVNDAFEKMLLSGKEMVEVTFEVVRVVMRLLSHVMIQSSRKMIGQGWWVKVNGWVAPQSVPEISHFWLVSRCIRTCIVVSKDRLLSLQLHSSPRYKNRKAYSKIRLQAENLLLRKKQFRKIWTTKRYTVSRRRKICGRPQIKSVGVERLSRGV